MNSLYQKKGPGLHSRCGDGDPRLSPEFAAAPPFVSEFWPIAHTMCSSIKHADPLPCICGLTVAPSFFISYSLRTPFRVLQINPRDGLPKLRAAWVARRRERGDAVVTQQAYAKQGCDYGGKYMYRLRVCSDSILKRATATLPTCTFAPHLLGMATCPHIHV